MVTTRGRALLEDGRPIRLHGINIGSWLNIEDFMIGLNG